MARRRGRTRSTRAHAPRPRLAGEPRRPPGPAAGARSAEIVERARARPARTGRPTRPRSSTCWPRPASPGLTAMPSGRFFGFVIGGTHPAALAADWLTSAWDQNAGLRSVTPAATAVEDVAEAWVTRPARAARRERGRVRHRRHDGQLHLPGRRRATPCSRRAGWDVGERGLVGSPGVRVLVGEERHDSVDLVLRYLGLGAPEPVAADDAGPDRRRPRSRPRSATVDGRPTIVALQAGNVHSGRLRPVRRGDRGRPRPRRLGPRRRRLRAVRRRVAAAPAPGRGLRGRRLLGDRRPQDAQRPLRLRARHRPRPAPRCGRRCRWRGLPRSSDAAGDPFEKVPELSRRGRARAGLGGAARAGPVRGGRRWSTGCAGHAARFAEGIAAIDGAEVLNDVVFTQVCAAFGDDARTLDVVGRMLADGTAWTSGLGLARPRGAADLGQQLVDDRRRRRAHPGRAPRTAVADIGEAEPPLDRLGTVRIARFTTGEDPQYGVVTGDLDEFGQPAEDAVVVALAGDPLYVGVKAARGGAPARRRPAARAGAAAQQGGRHRPQLRRPRRRAGQRGARRAADVPQAEHQRDRARRPDLLPAADRGPPLRGRARRRDRPDLPRRPGRAGDRRDLRLHDRQRRHRPRPAALRRAVHPGQGLRLVLPARARGSRPTSTRRHFADGVARADPPQRRRRAGRHHHAT